MLEDDLELEETALHEAEHYVVSMMVGKSPRFVSIVPGDGFLGKCGGGMSDSEIEVAAACIKQGKLSFRRYLIRDAVVWLSGFGETGIGRDDDLERARLTIEAAFGDAGDDKIDALESIAARILSWKRVDAAVTYCAQVLLRELELPSQRLNELDKEPAMQGSQLDVWRAERLLDEYEAVWAG